MAEIFYDIDDPQHFSQKAKITGEEKIQVSADQFVTTEQIASLAKVVDDHTIGENILHISTKSYHAPDYLFNTIIEGVSDDDLKLMANSDEYRICLLSFRRGSDTSAKWRIPMLPYLIAKRLGKTPSPNNIILETDTWWPITGRITKWFRGDIRLSDAVNLGTVEDAQHKFRFRSTRNKKAHIGVAIFKYTGKGGEGWTRISNIAYITLFVTNSGNIIVKSFRGSGLLRDRLRGGLSHPFADRVYPILFFLKPLIKLTI